MMNPLDRAIDAAGGVLKLALAIGLTQSAVSNWRARGSVPAEHCAAIEVAVGGRVTRRDLRPDDYARIWPELAGNPPITTTEPATAGG